MVKGLFSMFPSGLAGVALLLLRLSVAALTLSASYLPAVAAFAGSAIGGIAMLASSWVTQNRINRADRLARSADRRQDLYKQFIEEAARLYAHALLNDKPDVPGLARAYALVDQMRVLSSTAQRIFIYSTLLVPISLLPLVIGCAGEVYTATAVVCGAIFVRLAVKLRRSGGANRSDASRLFVFSVFYLFALFAALSVDRRDAPPWSSLPSSLGLRVGAVQTKSVQSAGFVSIRISGV